ncbi:MAG: hypothetical protein COA42_11325 [Alteromonadaceae bacterium]|nr:MAG: hypothetical protein COA42_11325 [Alteromonadaceae bacterium]
MQCPSCKSGALLPVEVDTGLVGAGCAKCHGVLLSLIQYRFWADSLGGALASSASLNDGQYESGGACIDSTGVKLCPKCSKFMTKYQIGVDSGNRIELCSHCDEVWLDKGEWHLLKELELQKVLPEIFTRAWQNNIRKKRQERNWQEHFGALIGEQDFERVAEFKRWLDAHDKASDIKHYLTINFDV